MIDNTIREAALSSYWAEGWLALYRAFEAQLIVDAVNRKLPNLWLDAGCGDGRFAQLLRIGCCTFGGPVGFDVDAVRLAKADILNQYSSLVRGDLLNFPFVEDAFPVVILNSVLEHCQNPTQTLKEIRRVLHPGGDLLFTVPTRQFESLLFGSRLLNALGLSAYSNWYGSRMSQHIRHFHYWNLEEIIRLLGQVGLSILSSQMYASSFMSLAGDLLHLIRIVGVGGSRYSRLSETELTKKRFSRCTKGIAMAIEHRLITFEESRILTGANFGMMFIHARKTC